MGTEASINEAQVQHILENTLIRRIHPDWFDPNLTPEILEKAWQLGGELQTLNVFESEIYKAPHNCLRGGHGLVSTAMDYLKFARMLLHMAIGRGRVC